MQTLILDPRSKANGLKPSPLREEEVEPGESPFPLNPYVEDLDDARRALGNAARVIRAQDDRIRQLESIALTDELTGLFNRRGLLIALQRELAAARRDDAAHGVLVMIDLDGFKTINDRWGHVAGDEYLRAVAYALSSDVRSSDLVARPGGDEFAVLLTHIGEEAGAARVAALEQSFNSRVSGWNCESVPLRGSFGFTAYNGGDVPETVMAAADLKLYAHKARKLYRAVRIG
jgi:diguanylate cyclase (GGDEF)-like protein